MKPAKICVLIPARAGSKGIPNKNVRLLGGYPLIAYSIAAAKLCAKVDRVIVSTDSEQIVDISLKYGAEVPFTRPSEQATDVSPDRGFVIHALKWFEKEEGSIPQYIVHLRPTTPLRISTVIDDAIEELVLDAEATSLRSAHEAPETPFKWFMKNERGCFSGFGSDSGYSNKPRQMLPKVYIPNGYVDVLRSSYVMNSEDIHGDRIKGYISPVCCEVDTCEDFEFLEFKIAKYGNSLLDYLIANYPKKG